VGWPELLQALEAEAARAVQAILAGAEAEAARLRAGAAEASRALVEEARGRARAEGEARRQGALAEAALVREREVLLGQRRLLAALREEAAARALAGAGQPVLARLIGEVVAAAPAGPLLLEVDPGQEAAARAVLEADHAELLPRLSLRVAPARRGGVRLRAGSLWLDDTLPARLERAWPALEPALVRLLFSGEG